MMPGILIILFALCLGAMIAAWVVAWNYGVVIKCQDSLLAEREEMHRMQLAAISTASIQNTATAIQDRIGPENPYYTQAYAEVCVAVDREMRERDQKGELADSQ